MLELCADNNDFATLLTQHNMEMALRQRRSSRLTALERALKRLDLDDDFGTCLECGEDIGLARIKANPSAELCVHCQAEAERAHQGLRLAARAREKAWTIVPSAWTCTSIPSIPPAPRSGYCKRSVARKASLNPG